MDKQVKCDNHPLYCLNYILNKAFNQNRLSGYNKSVN